MDLPTLASRLLFVAVGLALAALFVVLALVLIGQCIQEARARTRAYPIKRMRAHQRARRKGRGHGPDRGQ